MDLPFSVHELRDNDNPSVLFIEAPHTSENGVPPEHKGKHTGSDLGSLALLEDFLERFRRAAAVSSNRSRIGVVEHNRTDKAELNQTEPYCLAGCYPKDMPEEEKARRLREDYWPYIDAVYDQIEERFIRRKKLPLLISLHTFTPILNGGGLHPLMNGKKHNSFLSGKRRFVFNVAGSEKSVFVQTIAKQLQKEFFRAYRRGQMKGMPTLLTEDICEPVSLNGIFSQNKILPFRKPNPDLPKIMSPRYPKGRNGENWDFPYASLETRQDVVGNPRIREVYFRAIRNTVGNPHVLRELRELEKESFCNSPRVQRENQGLQPGGIN